MNEWVDLFISQHTHTHTYIHTHTRTHTHVYKHTFQLPSPNITSFSSSGGLQTSSFGASNTTLRCWPWRWPANTCRSLGRRWHLEARPWPASRGHTTAQTRHDVPPRHGHHPPHTAHLQDQSSGLWGGGWSGRRWGWMVTQGGSLEGRWSRSCVTVWIWFSFYLYLFFFSVSHFIGIASKLYFLNVAYQVFFLIYFCFVSFSS